MAQIHVIRTNGTTIAVTPSGGFTISDAGAVTFAVPIATGVSGLGVGVATALAQATGAPLGMALVDGALGTPTSGNLSLCSLYPVGSLADAGTGVLTALAQAVTGSGGIVLTTSPVLASATSTTSLVARGIAAANVPLVVETLTGATTQTGNLLELKSNYYGGALVTLAWFDAAGSLTTPTVYATGGFHVTNYGGIAYGGATHKLALLGWGGDFIALNFGGVTSSYPGLKRVTTTLQVRLADDSADASLTALNLTASGTLAVTGATTLTGLLAANGNMTMPATTPASASAAGVANTVCRDADYIYVCTATNTWKRVAISTW